MGGITQAMASVARERGVTLRTGCAVSRILVENGAAVGVVLEDGEIVRAGVVAANTDPKRTFLKLLGAEHLPEAFARDIGALRQESASLRMNLALRALPDFAARPESVGRDEAGVTPWHQASISLIESKDHVEAAFHSARRGVPADPPVIEALFPSTLDDTLTDAPGTHVMSLLCKYMPYDLAEGRDWDTEKDAVVARILAWVERFLPGLNEKVAAVQCLTPLDLERTFGMTRGDIFHGRLEPDQLYSARPHPDAAQYATPVPGLYLCGSGAHPGGGVTGAPGHNAAQRILRDR